MPFPPPRFFELICHIYRVPPISPVFTRFSTLALGEWKAYNSFFHALPYSRLG